MTEEADQKAVLVLLEKWRLATAAKDTDAIIEMVADDVVFLPSSAPPIKGKAAVEQMYRAFFPQYSEINQTAIIKEIQISGDWAFLWGTDELRLRPESGSAAGSTLKERG